MNIGIVTTWFERGAAYVSRQFMDVLEKTDNVYIYARGGERYAQDDPKWNLDNVWWGKRDEILIASSATGYIDKKDFINWIKPHNLDVIIFNEQRFYQPIIWAKDLGIKCIAYVDYYTKDSLKLFDLYDSVICNTLRHFEAMRNHHNPIYLKWGTNTSLFKPSDAIHDKLVFFHSAGMSPFRKGTDLLIKAFYNISERTKGKLVIHSQVDLFKNCSSCINEINTLLKEGSLEIIEKTVTAPGLFFLGDVYVYPSRLDGIGLTLMEALASGLPVITIDNPPMNEFVEPPFGSLCSVEKCYYREDGYYWPMCDVSVDSLSNTLRDYLSGTHDIKKMKISARNYAENSLDFEKNMTTLRSYVNDVQLIPITDELRRSAISYDKSSFSIVGYGKAVLKKILSMNQIGRRYLQNRH